jgi:hypothetical protein
MISKKIVIPNGFSKSKQPDSSFRFFAPRLILVQVDQPVEFKNEDISSHYLESVKLQEKPDNFFTTGEIKSGQSAIVELRNYRRMIPYRCRLHPVERGVILMTNKNEKDLTDTERLRLLTKTEFEQEFWNLIRGMDIEIE